MSTQIRRLQEEHHRLRRVLAAARGAVSMAPETHFVVRELCVALARQLETHCQREAEAIAWSGVAWGEEPVASVPVDHQDHLRSLRIITRYLIAGTPSGPSDERYRALGAVVEGLEEEMQLQEWHLFPLLLALETDDEWAAWELHDTEVDDATIHLSTLDRRGGE